MPWSAISQRGLLSAKRATRFGTASSGFGSMPRASKAGGELLDLLVEVGVGEFDFWLAVGVSGGRLFDRIFV